jgi:NCAIR mutase (PurE)-related protein
LRGIVTTADAIQLLEKFRAGKISLTDAVRAFQAPPVADLGFAQVDTHRALAQGLSPRSFTAGARRRRKWWKIARQIRQREERF